MLEYDGLVFRDTDNEAYCPTCYNMSGLSIRLSANQNQGGEGLIKSWQCGVCNQMIKPERMHSFN